MQYVKYNRSSDHKILGWCKRWFGVFHKMLQKNQNKLFGQHNVKSSYRLLWLQLIAFFLESSSILNFTEECFLTNCFLFVPKRGTQPSAAFPGSLPTPLAHHQSAHFHGGGSQALSFPPVCSVHPGYLWPPATAAPTAPHSRHGPLPQSSPDPRMDDQVESLPAASQSLQTWHKQNLRSIKKLKKKKRAPCLHTRLLTPVSVDISPIRSSQNPERHPIPSPHPALPGPMKTPGKLPIAFRISSEAHTGLRSPQWAALCSFLLARVKPLGFSGSLEVTELLPCCRVFTLLPQPEKAPPSLSLEGPSSQVSV